MEPSLSHNSDFIHAGAEDSLGWEGAADKLVEIVQTVPIGQVPNSGSDLKKTKNKTKKLKTVKPGGKQREILLMQKCQLFQALCTISV